MTQKEKILAEIERLRNDFPKVISQKEKDCQWLYWRGLNKIKYFINSLPEEPVSEDFKKFEEQYLEKEKEEILSVYDRHAGLVDGAQWQKKKTIDKACMYLNEHRDGFITDDYIKDFRKALEEE